MSERALKERLEAYVYIEPKISANYSQIQHIRNSKVDGGAVMASMTESPWTMHPVSEIGISVSQKEEIKALYNEIRELAIEAETLRDIINVTAKEYDPIVSLALYWKYLSGEGMTWEDVAGRIHYPNQGRALQKRVERFFIKMSQMSPLSQNRAV